LTFGIAFANISCPMKRINVKLLIRNYLMLIIGAFLGALAMYIFVLPNYIVPGGASGIASILQYSIGLHAQYGLILLNIPLLVLSCIFLSRDFAIKTIVVTVLTSVFLSLIELVKLPVFQGEMLVSVVFGGVIGGISLVFCYVGGGSSGGTEIVARLIMKKNPEVQEGKVLIICNLFIMTAGGFFTQAEGYDLWIVVYSLIYSYVCSFALDRLMSGFDPIVKFSIITRKPIEVSQQLMQYLNRGVSSIETYGGNGQQTDYYMLVAVVQFRQAPMIKKLLQDTDADCFAFTTDIDYVVSRPDFNMRYTK